MALDSGIEISESEIFTGVSAKAYFGTRRFDRHGNDRLNLHSAAIISTINYCYF
jgi:serine/threonine-protein kinase HipA